MGVTGPLPPAHRHLKAPPRQQLQRLVALLAAAQAVQRPLVPPERVGLKAVAQTQGMTEGPI